MYTNDNYCLLTSSNEVALNRSGVNVKKYKVLVLTLCGLRARIAGMIVTARLNCISDEKLMWIWPHDDAAIVFHILREIN
ncbi:hypothetical protein HJV72_13580 [Extibacter sp. GGCC_0201]|nr:hypothetical protein [Extibacter sp. GGCC_0201]